MTDRKEVQLRINCNITICTILSFIICVSAPSYASREVNYTKLRVAGVPVNVITANLNSPNVFVTPAYSRWGVGTCESFRTMIRRMRPAAAINGTFFCTRTLRPTGDIVIGGQLVWKGYLGTAVTVDNNGRVKFIPTRGDENYKWSDYNMVMAAGPTLILRGKTLVMPRAEGFRSGVHFSRRSRAAVGLTYNNKLIFVTTKKRIYYRDLARVMKKLHCWDAAVLDGGSSIGLYCEGKLIQNPGRGLTNCLMVYGDPASYEQHRALCCPIERPKIAYGHH